MGRVLLPLYVAFKAMDGLRKPTPKRTLSFKDDDNKPKKALLGPYSADPDGYNGPPVMVCLRPAESLPRSAPTPTQPEELHLYYHPNTNSVKKFSVPTGNEGDSYLMVVVYEEMEEMEASGEDGNELTFDRCLVACTEHLDLGDDALVSERRVSKIWQYALHKLNRNKFDGVEFDLEETKKAIAESDEVFTDNILANANRLDHVEERVDDLQEQVDDFQKEVNARLKRLELAVGLSLFEQASSNVEIPEKLERHWRVARARILTILEASTVKYYTTPEGCAEINIALRTAFANAVAVSREISTKKKLIESALVKIAKPYVGRVYRCVDMPKDWMEDIKAQIAAGQRGRLNIPFSDAGFLSSSTQISGSFKLKTCRFVIQSKTGKEIAAYSAHPDEYEVLFPTFTQFIIYDACEFDNGNLFIRMREV